MAALAGAITSIENYNNAGGQEDKGWVQLSARLLTAHLRWPSPGRGRALASPHADPRECLRVRLAARARPSA